MNKKAARIIVLSLLLLSITFFTGWVQANPKPQETRGTVLYVSSGGSGACTSWADACDLQAALTAAIATDEIWVKAGTYLPTGTTNRSISFVLKDGVAIFGGFAGAETALDQRDLTSNPTILSGDIGSSSNDNDNSYHVVTGDSLGTATILDGFIITAGNANGTSPLDKGGGMYNTNNSSPSLTNLTFSENSAAFGGGMNNWWYSSPTLTNVTFSDNTATNHGGGFYTSLFGNPTLTNVTFSGNTASSFGGGMVSEEQSNPTLTNTTFFGNIAGSVGGGMYIFNNITNMTNSIMWGNLMGTNIPNQIFNSSSATTTITYSDILGPSVYPGIGNINTDPLLGPLADNGGFSYTHALLHGSPAIDTGTNTGCPLSDQRGAVRPFDGDRNGTLICDMGAYEFNLWIQFVDKDAVGLNNGTSWANAFSDLQDALAIADQGSEIRVAEGTYKPTTTTDRELSFVLKNGVAIFGGFDGTESTLDQRDWISNLTILSGEIGSTDDTGDNSYHVVYGLQVDATAILDGFTITAGNANGSNPPDDLGGGMYNAFDSSPTLTNLTFSNNSAWGGGGIYNYIDSSPTLTNISFSNNSAVFGGGMFNHSANPSLNNVTFSFNSVSVEGGGIYNYESSPSLTNVTFSNNLAEYGGGMSNYNNSSPTLTNVTLSNNSATFGGGIYNATNSNPTLTNVILWSNSIDQVFNDGTSNPDITYSDIQGGYAGEGNIDVDPLLGPLVNNGSFTQTYALLTGSSAIDTGTNIGCPVSDQRGVVRPIDGDLDGTPECDMGAYEYKFQWLLFVDQDAVGLNNGTSWADAFTDLQSALAIADYGKEIWVAEGTYKPTVTDRMISFILKDGVAIYGGFAGTESTRDLRNWIANPTILSGDIGVTSDNRDNSFHVVTGTSLDSTAILDGFKIMDGNANHNFPLNYGGGMYLTTHSNPTLKNLTFSNNSAEAGGGVAIFLGSNPTLTNVTFSNNSADGGGGMFNRESNPTLINVSFFNNTADNGGGLNNYWSSSPILINVTFSGNTASKNGGGMFNSMECSPTLTNVTISANTATENGGGMYNDFSSPTLTNVTFSNNTATNGGGMHNYIMSNPALTNVTFLENTAASNGGGMSNQELSSPTLTNAILWGNTGGQVYNTNSSTPTIIYSDVQGGYTGTGNIDLDPLLGALANNGGFTQTHALGTSSPAIDTGSTSVCPATDQRGHVRPIDGDMNGSSICDMGAYEYDPFTYIFLPLIIR